MKYKFNPFIGKFEILPNAKQVSWKTLSSGLLSSNVQDMSHELLGLIGAINGIASLDGSGKVPSGQLPSYVDDILEYADLASFPVTGETGKIYVDISTGLIYRWSGSLYIEVSVSSSPLVYKNGVLQTSPIKIIIHETTGTSASVKSLNISSYGLNTLLGVWPASIRNISNVQDVGQVHIKSSGTTTIEYIVTTSKTTNTLLISTAEGLEIEANTNYTVSFLIIGF